MDTKSFYKDKESSAEGGGGGSGKPGPGQDVEKQLKIVKAEKRLLEPEVVWREFPRQQAAFEFANSCHQNVAVFAFESEDIGREGQRRYLVTTYYVFGQKYLAMKSPRHYYEVIVEGSACHLYFDIEFKREHNPQVDPLATLETFIQYVCFQLHSQLGVDCNRSNALDLDSSTPQKFSRHLVFHLPGAVFTTNTHAGNFVHHICEQLRELKGLLDVTIPEQHAMEQVFAVPKRGGPTKCPPVDRLLSLFVLNEKREKILICDEAVYTRNRNFRLFLSSKLGKDVCLRVARENKFRSSYHEDSVRSRVFNTLIDSLVCNVKYDGCRLLQFEGPHSKRKVRTKEGRSSERKSPSPSPLEGFTCSPYPLVDQFVTSQLTRGGVQGSIRQWTYFPQGKMVVYNIQHNRWCENIGRAHKSNNIMIIADLRRGVYYQKCHDPDCKRIDFRSNEYRIPTQCNPVQPQSSSRQTGDHEQQGLDEDFGQLTDEEFFERTVAEVDLSQGVSTDEREADYMYDAIFAEASKLPLESDHVTSVGDHVSSDSSHVTLLGDHVTSNRSHVVHQNDHMTLETAELNTNTDQLLDNLFEEAFSDYDTSMHLLQAEGSEVKEVDNATVCQSHGSCAVVKEGKSDCCEVSNDDFNLSATELESFFEKESDLPF